MAISQPVVHIVLLSLVTIACGVGLLYWIKSPSFESFITWVQFSLGFWGYLLLAFFIFVLHFPCMAGYGIVAVVIGYIYGWVGLVVIVVGNGVGFPVFFYAIKYLIKQSGYVESQINNWKYLQAVVMAISQNPIKLTALLRAGPITVGVSNIMLAVSTIDFWTYFWVSSIAHLPKDIIFVAFGHYTARSIAEIIQGKQEMTSAEVMAVAVQVLTFVAFTVTLYYYGKKALEELEQKEIEVFNITEEDHSQMSELETGDKPVLRVDLNINSFQETFHPYFEQQPTSPKKELKRSLGEVPIDPHEI